MQIFCIEYSWIVTPCKLVAVVCVAAENAEQALKLGQTWHDKEGFELPDGLETTAVPVGVANDDLSAGVLAGEVNISNWDN